jgi:hypothetical protein
VQVGAKVLAVTSKGPAQLHHVVGGIVLSTDTVAPRALPGVLAAFVVRTLAETGLYDDAGSTAARGGVAAGRTSATGVDT